MDGWTPAGAALPWSVAATATVLAAGLALTGTVATTAWGVVRWRRDVERSRSDDTWERVQWVVELYCSTDPARVTIGRSAARAMYGMSKSGRSDDPVATLVLEQITEGDRDGLPDQ